MSKNTKKIVIGIGEMSLFLVFSDHMTYQSCNIYNSHVSHARNKCLPNNDRYIC